MCHAANTAKEKSNDINHSPNRYARPSERRDEAHDKAPCWPTSRPRGDAAKKAPKGRTKAKVSKPGARSGSKTAKILDLLRRPGGASAKELLKATGWQPHSLRGFLSGTVGKKMGLALTSTKGSTRRCKQGLLRC
jgi:hypothetical protein